MSSVKINEGVFTDVEDSTLSDSSNDASNSLLEGVEIISAGSGSASFHFDSRGLWMGSDAPESATFFVDINGVVQKMVGANISGYIVVGDAGQDIIDNADDYVGKITGTIIKDGTVAAAKIVANSITANQIASNTITANQISANTITGGQINASSVASSVGSFLSLNANQITAGTMVADRISGGSLTIGGNSDSLGTISVRNSSNTEITKLNNSGIIVRNTRGLFFEQTTSGQYGDIQVNSSNQMSISLPTTNQFFIKDYNENDNLFTVSYSAVYARAAFITSANYIQLNNGDSSFNMSSGTSLNVSGDGNISVGGKKLYWSRYDISSNTVGELNIQDTRLAFWVDGGNVKFGVWKDGQSWAQYQKNAILKTSKGYRAVNCMESPETWFMDFVGKNKELDPMFEEITEGECKFIKCDDGGYQVWRRRKGFANKRFEERTEAQARSNAAFYAQAYRKTI